MLERHRVLEAINFHDWSHFFDELDKELKDLFGRFLDLFIQKILAYISLRAQNMRSSSR
jgi:hypothetical protein